MDIFITSLLAWWEVVPTTAIFAEMERSILWHLLSGLVIQGFLRWLPTGGNYRAEPQGEQH